uniref:SCP domain-containing protein n=1 Tax=Macrostomum lignano TaxID=282301 RepID=A0A1I8IT23_9PLAT
TWNTRLEGLAQAAANRCVFEHNYGGDYSGLGENLYLGFRTNVSDMITLFYMEHLAYNFSSHQCNRPNVFNFPSCGHYTQVVGSSVKEVGCAIASCSTGNLFVCEYDRTAPSPPYVAGPPCSACSGTSFCYEGLCINGSMRDDLVTETVMTETV